MTISKKTIEDAAQIRRMLEAGANKRRRAHQARIGSGLARVAVALSAAIAVVGLSKGDR